MIKHKIIKDFQYILPDKKIFILKSGIVLENYKYSHKGDSVQVDSDLVNSNVDFFQFIDWKMELISYLKSNKIPQPGIVSKKIIPFIDNLMSDLSHQTPRFDDRLSDLDLRERRLSNKEEDLNIRQKRIDSRESLFKEDIQILDRRESDVKKMMSDVKISQNDLDRQRSEFNEKERNFDLNNLKSTEEIDSKYEKMRLRIEEDLKNLSDKENSLEDKSLDILKREILITEKEESLESREKKFHSDTEEFKIWADDIKRISNDIESWESLNWKMKRLRKKPQSAED